MHDFINDGISQDRLDVRLEQIKLQGEGEGEGEGEGVDAVVVVVVVVDGGSSTINPKLFKRSRHTSHHSFSSNPISNDS